MKKYLFILILLTQPLLAQFAPTSSVNVVAAQQHVWDIAIQLNSAIYKLNTMKLDWQKDNMTEALTQAKQNGDAVSIPKIEDKLLEIDHRKDLEKQKLDLNNQLVAAKQQGDQAKVDSVLFQLKSLP